MLVNLSTWKAKKEISLALLQNNPSTEQPFR